ncbi:MAG: DMT family transporter [Candidatus Fermentibacteraceae bacterium]|nr:DMT family transporter [Candidatus Fermentibacteraceae bacterium]MBN2608647.1 DMT family transporter [Candidatus Fermentibacteraceae bacterium]
MGAGELAALGTALCWTVTVMSFEAAGRRVGSIPVNMIRLILGLAFLSAYCGIVRGMPLPLDATGFQWLWLGLSGAVGFVLGDLCLFRAFVLIGSRISMVIYALVPPVTAFAGWVFLRENLSIKHWMGILITVTGICMVILIRESRKVKLAHPLSGVLLALGGTLGQAAGLVLSKYGMGEYSAFAANQIRIIAALAIFIVILPFTGLAGRIARALRNREAVGFIGMGSFFGPFLGVSLSLVAVRLINVGIASTIMAMVPVFIIVPEVALTGKRVRPLEVAGALVAVAGVALVSL